jgi:hypothetical protein
MGAKLKNNAYGTLLASISASDVTITLATGNGAQFPSLAAGEYFYATLVDVNNNLEVVKVTARVSDILTVVRGQDGTTARAYLVGDRIEQRMVTALFNEKLDATSGEASKIHVTDYVDFGPTPGLAGRAKWNDTDGTIDLGLKGGAVTLQVGQEMVQRIYNDTGAALLEGQVVYTTGAEFGRKTVAKASSTAEGTSAATFGVITENISAGLEGYVTTYGLVRNIDTSMFIEGAPLYVGSTPGTMTDVKPVAPEHLVKVGYCIVSNSTTGVIFVDVMNGYELDELHDVLMGTKADKHVLQYDAASSLWKNGRLNITATVPATSSDTGTAGWIAFDSNYVYVCIATNTWKRLNLQNW